MSTRPQRARAASTMALSVASLATSASNATQSAFDCRVIATVSWAEARLLSTASTLAPSCAKRMTVARPLPMPSPGDWPAPITMATLSSRRMCNPPRWAGWARSFDAFHFAGNCSNLIRRDAAMGARRYHGETPRGAVGTAAGERERVAGARRARRGLPPGRPLRLDPSHQQPHLAAGAGHGRPVPDQPLWLSLRADHRVEPGQDRRRRQRPRRLPLPGEPRRLRDP